ncbi:MAG TPA: DUF554 domain-containing protein [Clostridiales bacterium]|jgi:uncharacterized membrane protein YqgA involved in biofilm formation|nr:DUF554 domain-containing protein [Clostridiales bacterium]
MFGILSGAIVNALFVIAGTAVGLVFKAEWLKSIGERIFQVFALFVLAMGVNGARDLSRPLLILFSLAIGTAIGELADLDGRIDRLGQRMQRRFSKSDDSRFSEGFMQASLLFCVGSMTVLGSMQSGMSNDHSILYTKSVLDGFAAATLAIGFGIGVGFSVLTVLIYEGGLTLLAGTIAPVMSDEIVALSSTIGSLFLIGMALNMLNVTKLKLANFLPAMFIPILIEAVRLIIS